MVYIIFYDPSGDWPRYTRNLKEAKNPSIGSGAGVFSRGFPSMEAGLLGKCFMLVLSLKCLKSDGAEVDILFAGIRPRPHAAPGEQAQESPLASFSDAVGFGAVPDGRVLDGGPANDWVGPPTAVRATQARRINVGGGHDQKEEEWLAKPSPKAKGAAALETFAIPSLVRRSSPLSREAQAGSKTGVLFWRTQTCYLPNISGARFIIYLKVSQEPLKDQTRSFLVLLLTLGSLKRGSLQRVHRRQRRWVPQ